MYCFQKEFIATTPCVKILKNFHSQKCLLILEFFLRKYLYSEKIVLNVLTMQYLVFLKKTQT